MAPATKNEVALNDAIAEVVDMIRDQAVKHGISVRTELAQSLPSIQGDQVQLQQVVLNLIVNAIEAMSGTSQATRELLIRTEAGGAGNVLVIVADSGPGLAPTALAKLFEPFYTTKPEGLGLGLSICRSIVEAHGGQLSARANAPHGAVFQFFVPAEQHS
jgi:signal transduction histidine kinase